LQDQPQINGVICERVVPMKGSGPSEHEQSFVWRVRYLPSSLRTTPKQQTIEQTSDFLDRGRGYSPGIPACHCSVRQINPLPLANALNEECLSVVAVSDFEICVLFLAENTETDSVQFERFLVGSATRNKGCRSVLT